MNQRTIPTTAGGDGHPSGRRYGRRWQAVTALAAVSLVAAACGSSGSSSAAGSSSSAASSAAAAPSSAASSSAAAAPSSAAPSAAAPSSGAPSAGAPVANKSGKHLTFALIPGLTTDPFYITMDVGAQEEAKKLGVTLLWQGGTTFSPETQLPVVTSLLAKHPDGLLIAPTDVKALEAPIKQYIAAGIPVITVDTTIDDTSILTSRITSDNTQGGAAAADACMKLSHNSGAVAVINVQPGVSTTDARQTGFLNEMKAKYPSVPVVATEYDDDSPTTAESQASSIMLAHPNLTCIFGTNLYSAQGAGKAVQAAHKQGKVFVAGYDAEPAEIQMLKQGIVNILVIQQPALEGQLAVQYMYDYLTGDKSAIKTSVQLPNVIATSSQVNDPNITKYFYKTSVPNS